MFLAFSIDLNPITGLDSRMRDLDFPSCQDGFLSTDINPLPLHPNIVHFISQDDSAARSGSG